MKKLIIALSLGLIIGMASTVSAQSETVEAIFSKFNIIINGEYKELQTDPLVYQGTTYVPLREIGNLFGYDVTYKADTKTIELNQSETNVLNGNEGTQNESQPTDEPQEVEEEPMEENQDELPRLEWVEGQISFYETQIFGIKSILEKNISDEKKEEFRQTLSEYESKLEQLQQLKQQLESQQ